MTPLGDRGIPGLSDNERLRLDQALAAGELTDVWRRLHPLPEGGHGREAAAFTWRGSPAVQAQFKARYEGKAQVSGGRKGNSR